MGRRAEHPAIDHLRLWIGGVATALVAALLTLVIWWVVRDVLDIPALRALDDTRRFADDEAVDDAIVVFVATLVATAVLDALLVLAPTPLRFFGWLLGLAAAVVALAPWTTDGETAPKLARSIGTVVVALTVWSLLTGAARRSVRYPAPGRW